MAHFRVNRIRAGEYRVEAYGRVWFVERWVTAGDHTAGWFLTAEGETTDTADVYATKADAVRAAHDYSVPVHPNRR